MGKRKQVADTGKLEAPSVIKKQHDEIADPTANDNTNVEREDPSGQPSDGITEIELERARLIARNRARMIALGIPLALDTLSKLTVSAVPRAKSAFRPAAAAPPEPSRHSKRLKGKSASWGALEEGDEGAGAEKKEEEEEEEEVDSELAQFVVDGRCPRCGACGDPRPVMCGKAMSRGHTRHLEQCTGPPAVVPLVLSDEELRAQADMMRERENERLAALELEGLVDLTPEHALFIVIGSTGNHYQVTLKDLAHKCQCVDHRIRKHDCKHIRLILSALGCDKAPISWREAVDRKFLVTNSGDVQPATGAVAAAAGAAAAGAGSGAGKAARGGKGSKAKGLSGQGKKKGSGK